MSTSAIPVRRYHHGDLRNGLLDAATAVARAHGADAVTLREAARRAGVSHSAAYKHFTDKNDLLRGVALRAFGAMTAALRAAAERPGARLADLGAAYTRFALEHPAEFRFMFDRALCMPDGVEDPLELAAREAEGVLRDVLAGRPGTAPGDPALDAAVLAAWSQVHGLTTILLETPAFKAVDAATAEALARRGLETLETGLRVAPASGS